MVSGAMRDCLAPTDAFGRQEMADVRAEWAQEQYARAAAKFARVAPVGSLNDLNQGDVLISKSGNARLVLRVIPDRTNPKFSFLSRLRVGSVKLEAAELRRIDCGRLEAVVVRRGGNPLERFAEAAAGLEAGSDLFHNVRALLLFGPDGERLAAALAGCRRDTQGILRVALGLAPDIGRIEAIGAEVSNRILVRAEITVNGLKLPAEDYINTVTFYAGASPQAKARFVAACVLANTLENARNLNYMARLAAM